MYTSNQMTTVGIKTFRAKLAKYLGPKPVILTNRGQCIAWVIPNTKEYQTIVMKLSPPVPEATPRESAPDIEREATEPSIP